MHPYPEETRTAFPTCADATENVRRIFRLSSTPFALNDNRNALPNRSYPNRDRMFFCRNGHELAGNVSRVHNPFSLYSGYRINTDDTRRSRRP